MLLYFEICIISISIVYVILVEMARENADTEIGNGFLQLIFEPYHQTLTIRASTITSDQLEALAHESIHLKKLIFLNRVMNPNRRSSQRRKRIE